MAARAAQCLAARQSIRGRLGALAAPQEQSRSRTGAGAGRLQRLQRHGEPQASSSAPGAAASDSDGQGASPVRRPGRRRRGNERALPAEPCHERTATTFSAGAMADVREVTEARKKLDESLDKINRLAPVLPPGDPDLTAARRAVAEGCKSLLAALGEAPALPCSRPSCVACSPICLHPCSARAPPPPRRHAGRQCAGGPGALMATAALHLQGRRCRLLPSSRMPRP